MKRSGNLDNQQQWCWSNHHIWLRYASPASTRKRHLQGPMRLLEPGNVAECWVVGHHSVHPLQQVVNSVLCLWRKELQREHRLPHFRCFPDLLNYLHSWHPQSLKFQSTASVPVPPPPFLNSYTRLAPSPLSSLITVLKQTTANSHPPTTATAVAHQINHAPPICPPFYIIVLQALSN